MKIIVTGEHDMYFPVKDKTDLYQFVDRYGTAGERFTYAEIIDEWGQDIYEYNDFYHAMEAIIQGVI